MSHTSRHTLPRHRRARSSQPQSRSRASRIRLAGLIIGLILVATGSVWLAVGDARTGTLSFRLNPVVTKAPGPQGSSAARINVLSYVAPGLPVALSIGVVENDKGASQVLYEIANKGSFPLQSVHLVLNEYNPAGKLRRTEGWIQEVALAPDATQQFSIRLRKRVTPGRRLVLAVESATGPSGTNRADPVGLTNAAVTRLDGSTKPDPAVAFKPEEVAADYGASFCLNAFRKATELSKAEEPTTMADFRCDRRLRFYAFNYNR